MFWRRTFDFACHPLKPLPQQIFQIPSHAVNRKQAQVVDVNVAVPVGLPDLGRIDAVQPVFRGHIG